jgi:hypothetical protein
VQGAQAGAAHACPVHTPELQLLFAAQTFPSTQAGAQLGAHVPAVQVSPAPHAAPFARLLHAVVVAVG